MEKKIVMGKCICKSDSDLDFSLNLMKKIVLIILFSISFMLFFEIGFVQSATWWDINYDYRQTINVSTGINSPYKGYQNYTAQIVLDTYDDNYFLDNGNDLRIVYWNGSNNFELDREILDINTNYTRVRFKLQENILPSSTQNNYYLYYGNSGAGLGPKDLTKVYLWYDDASSNKEGMYIQGKVDSSAHGNNWRNSINWNIGGYYTYDTGDNYVDSLRPNGLIERDVYLEYESYQVDAYPNDMTTGPICRWQGTGSGSSENSDHFYYYEMAESTILAANYPSHDTITADNRAATIINYGLLPLFPANSWTRVGISSWGINPTKIKAYYQNESGGWGGYRFSGTHAAGSDNEGAGQFGMWLQQEEGRVKNFIARRYVEPEPSLISFNHTKYFSNINYSYIGVNSISTNYVLQNNILNISVEISCSNSFMGTCGNVSSQIMYNDSSLSFLEINDFDSNPFWIQGSNLKSCFLNSGDSCVLNWLVNATGDLGNYYKLGVNITSNYSEVGDIFNPDLSLRIVDMGVVSFNQSKYVFDSFDKNSGDKTAQLKIKSNFGDNFGINVSCLSGECSLITQNWVNGSNLNEGLSSSIDFICSDFKSGFISALFKVTSLGNPYYDTINISCYVNENYGPMLVSINKPNPSIITLVAKNKTFELNASVNCIGLCGNISAYPIYKRAKTGLSSIDPADSGWQIKQFYPDFKSGVYWIKTPAMLNPEKIYIDMDYDGGGWMLVGRGREGWNWDDGGRGTFLEVAQIPNGLSAFSPDYYSSGFINQLLNNTAVSSLDSGVRLRRALNIDGTNWQEVRWYFNTLVGWDWDFDSTISLSSYVVDGTNYGADDTRDAGANDHRRVFTYPWASHNNQEGFSYGSTITAGTNTPENYLWDYAVEGSSIPFTQVYVRPKIIDYSTGYLLNGSVERKLYSTSGDVKSCISAEDGTCNFNWILNITHNLGSYHNLSVVFISNISSIKLNQTLFSTVNVSDSILPVVNLISPLNNSKFIINSNTSFLWNVSDDSSVLNCSLYINGIFNQSKNCSNSLTNSINLSLGRGIYNWRIDVLDESSNLVSSNIYYFSLIKNVSKVLEKEISFENLNQYKIKINLDDLTLKNIYGKVIEWIYYNLNFGSLSPINSWINITSEGDYLGWDNENSINYSIAGVGNNYSIKNSYIIGLD